MAYQTAAASDAADLLDKLRLFLISAGWAVDLWADTTPAGSKQLAVHKGDFHATFLTNSGAGGGVDPGPYVGVYGHTGYTAGTQAAASPAEYCNGMAGPFVAYDFFEGEGKDGPYVHVVVETQAGVFKHFGTGVLDKEGAYSTGQYVFASRWYYGTSPAYINQPEYEGHRIPFNSNASPWGHVRADVDGFSPLWMEGRLGDYTNNRCVSSGFTRNNVASPDMSQTIRGPALASPSIMTGRTHLWPLWCLGERGSNFYSPLGAPPDMRFIRMDNFNPKDLLTLGTDEWKVFPGIRKNGLTGEPNSGVYGYAYRVND